MKQTTAQKLHAKIQSLPVWTRPVVGLLMALLIVATTPIWLPLGIGWQAWDTFFGDGD